MEQESEPKITNIEGGDDEILLHINSLIAEGKYGHRTFTVNGIPEVWDIQPHKASITLAIRTMDSLNKPQKEHSMSFDY